MVVADDCGDALTEYLEGADLSSFGGDDPWADLENGVDTLVDAFAAVSTLVKDYPTEDVAVSAVKLGKLVGASELSPSDKGAVKVCTWISRGRIT